MAATGESYQRALSRLRNEQASPKREGRRVDLLRVEYFGAEVTLATFEILETLSCVVMPSSPPPNPFAKSPLLALGRRTVH
jgi:hypothetical protein